MLLQYLWSNKQIEDMETPAEERSKQSEITIWLIYELLNQEYLFVLCKHGKFEVRS